MRLDGIVHTFQEKKTHVSFLLCESYDLRHFACYRVNDQVQKTGNGKTCKQRL